MKTIVLSTVVALVLLGCSSEDKQDKQQVVSEPVKQEVVQKETTPKAEATKSATLQKAQQTKETKIVKKVATPKPVQKVQKQESVKVAKVEKKVAKVTPKKEAVKTVKAEKKVLPAKPAIDGAKLFVKCQACHGQNAEKSALNKSQIIKGWSETKVLKALHGYKNGTYGGSMKSVMKSQIKDFDEEQLKALAKHISKL